MCRTVSRSRRNWVASARRLLLLACVASPFLATSVAAQILGDASPGTPGAIDGELRGPRNGGLGFPPPPREAPIAQAPGSGRFSLQRRPNTAIRRAPGDPTRAGTDQTFTPRGDARSRPIVATSRRPGDLTGTTFRDSTPKTFQPGPQTIIAAPAPGLGPVRGTQNRRRAPEQDPYAPAGYQMGSMLLRPAIEAGGGFDTNAARTTRGRSSPVYRLEAELKANSDWSRHRLDVDLRGAFTGYTAIDNVNRPEGDARIALRLDATRDLNFDIDLRSRVETESSTSVNLPTGSTGRTPYYTHAASLGATQRLGLASLGLRGNVERQIYGDIESGGATTSQVSRNLTGYGLRLRGGYEISPGIAPFVEAGIDRRDYDQRLDGSGFARSSSGATLRAGSTFELARTLTGEAAVGYTMRNYEDRRLANLSSPTADASLIWSISPLTTLNLRAQTEIVETTIAGSSGAIAYRGTATLTHAFLRNFTATVTFSLAETDYQKVDRQERTVGGGLRLEYKLNRAVALRGSYAYENYRVNVPGSNYQSHTFLTGIRITP
ncbi:MAG: outer membrane beta-barrel protein [Rhabdaerophilum sp.]